MQYNSVIRLAGGMTAACLLLAEVPAMAQSYGYTTLDFPGQTAGEAAAINDSNQVAGTFGDSSGAAHGFIWSGGTFTQVADA